MKELTSSENIGNLKKGGEIQLSASPNGITSKLGGLFLHTCSFNAERPNSEAANTSFYSYWFYPTRNRALYHFQRQDASVNWGHLTGL